MLTPDGKRRWDLGCPDSRVKEEVGLRLSLLQTEREAGTWVVLTADGKRRWDLGCADCRRNEEVGLRLS